MSKRYSKTLYLAVSITALMLSACGANLTNAATQTQAVNAIFTAAAQTIEAKTPVVTATPIPSQTPLPSQTPTITPTITATTIPPTSPIQNYCDNSLFVADANYPDNTVLNPGQAFEKTWTLQNIGTCTWKESYSITFAGGDMMNGATTSINQSVAAQLEANVSVKLVAPIKPGTYSGAWRMANSKGAPFGQVIYVVIQVGTPGTSTVTATAASAPAATSSATPSVTVTATP